jgi:hypothetical protein
MQAKFFFRKMLPKLLLLAVLSPLLAAFLVPFWSSQTACFHTGLELIRLFVLICSFLIITSIHKQNTQFNIRIGLGFLMVSIFDLFHIFHHQGVSYSYTFLCPRLYWLHTATERRQALMLNAHQEKCQLPWFFCGFPGLIFR